MVLQQNTLSGPISGPSTALPPPANQNQSLEQQALNGGGVDNKQQVSNFMNAMNRTGQGANNGLMSAPGQQPQQVQPLVNQGQMMNNGFTNANQTGQNMMTQSMQGTNTPGYYAGNQGTTAAYTSNPAGPQFSLTNPQELPINPNIYQSLNYQPQYSTAPNGLPANLGANQVNVPAGYVPPSTSGGGVIGGTASAPISDYGAAVTSPTAPAPSTITISPYQPNQNYSNYLTVSDENLKTEIAPAKNQVSNFLDAIHAHSYEYKDKQDGVGVFTSPMAQELEKTELGKQAVIETPRGKMVDYGRLGGVNLAAVSVVHREQQKLQKQVDQLRKMLKGTK